LLNEACRATLFFMINVEVQRNSSESATNLLKRFTKRVQGAGILNRIRGIRYSKRAESRYVRKKRTLKALKRREDRDHLIKLGKIVDSYR
jgi:ribosomal protein S21